MTALQALPRFLSRLRDPQAWISTLATVTFIALCTGAFEPAEAVTDRASRAAPAEGAVLALAEPELI